jgi:hypothetical protein
MGFFASLIELKGDTFILILQIGGFGSKKKNPACERGSLRISREYNTLCQARQGNSLPVGLQNGRKANCVSGQIIRI